METISIALICTIVGCIVGVIGFNRTRDKDIRSEAERWGSMSAKLDFITTNVTEIKTEVKLRDERMNKEISDIRKEVIECKQSVKSAHHRLDEFEKFKKGGK